MQATKVTCNLTSQGFPYKAVEWYSTALLLSKAFDAIKGMYEECKSL